MTAAGKLISLDSFTGKSDLRVTFTWANEWLILHAKEVQKKWNQKSDDIWQNEYKKQQHSYNDNQHTLYDHCKKAHFIWVNHRTIFDWKKAGDFHVSKRMTE